MKTKCIVLVTGGREFTDEKRFNREFLTYLKTLCKLRRVRKAELLVVVGDARGTDRLAWDFCKKHSVKFKRYKADWNRYGNAAGPIRNSEMVKQNKINNVFAFHDGKSKGTAHCLSIVSNLPQQINYF